MDGTIVDSTPVVERQWRRWAARHELNADAILAVSHGRRTIETMREVAPHLRTSDAEAACFDEEEARDSEGVIAMAGAAPLLSSLSPDSWAVVTSATLHLAHNRLRFAGLPIPSVLVSADDVREGKPDPEGYLLAAARLGVHPTECLVLEDTPAGIAAGLAAEMQVLAIGNTVARESLPVAPWLPDLTRLRVRHDDRLEVLISR